MRKLYWAPRDIFFLVLKYFNLKLIRINQKERPGVNLNVGCGSNSISGFIDLDFYSDHYYGYIKFYGSRPFNKVNYDMRKDKLPFNDNFVDNIYCSHVIEHVESSHVKTFFEESYRCLKKGGFLRVSCPDAFYLFNQLKEFPEYFSWHPMYVSANDATKCFVDELATHKLDLKDFGLNKRLNEYNYSELVNELSKGASFDENDPSKHISIWDPSIMKKALLDAGFQNVYESKPQGSSSPNMQGSDIDVTTIGMSCYVECYKST